MWAKLQPRILTALPVVLIAICSGLLFVRYPGQFSEILPTDFAVYARAWERVSSGQSPYVASDPSPFKYSPGVLALYGLLPNSSQRPESAWFVFGTLSVLSLALALWVGARNRWRSESSESAGRTLLWMVVGLAFAWKGILEVLDYGQIELLLLGIAVLAAACLRAYPMLAGGLAGTLPWFKLPWALLFVPFCVVSMSRATVSLGAAGESGYQPRKWRKVLSGYFLALFVWGAAVPSLSFGPERAMDLSRDWYVVLKEQPRELFLSQINQSLWASLQRWTGSGELALAIGGLIALFFLGRLILRSHVNFLKQYGPLAWISPWLLFTQLLNPLSWRWGGALVLGIPLAAETVDEKRLFRGRARIAIWALVIALWLLQLNPVVRSMGIEHWTSLHAYGAVTAFWIALLLLCL